MVYWYATGFPTLQLTDSIGIRLGTAKERSAKEGNDQKVTVSLFCPPFRRSSIHQLGAPSVIMTAHRGFSGIKSILRQAHEFSRYAFVLMGG